MRQPDHPELTRSFDLLWKGLEITTGAQREHRHDVLARQAQEKGLNLEGLVFTWISSAMAARRTAALALVWRAC
jgi:aspartyl/asparaginyl-tRNA synthetase